MNITERLIGDFTALGTSQDGVRPEVAVSIATGKITNLEEMSKGLVKVEMRVAGAKYPLGGFINSGEPVCKILEQAKERDSVVCVRFEKKRKAKVDPNTPIAELTKDMSTAQGNIVKLTVGVFDFNSGQWVLTSEAQSDPSEDDGQLLNVIKSTAYDSSTFFDAPARQTSAIVQGSTDKKANQLVTMYFFVVEQEHKNAYTSPLKDEARKAIAMKLLAACDMLQTSVYGLDAPNYGDYSHTKARSMLFQWTETHPLTQETISKEFNAWLKEFVTTSADIWKWAIKNSLPNEASNK